MAYDPTLPVNNSPIVSAELRNQFAGLKALIDQCLNQGDLGGSILLRIFANSSANTNGVDSLDLTVSDPPTQAEVQSIADKLDELIGALRR